MNGTNRRPDGLPDVEVMLGLEGGQIVARRGFHDLGDRSLLRKVEQQLLRRGFVLGEIPSGVN